MHFTHSSASAFNVQRWRKVNCVIHEPRLVWFKVSQLFGDMEVPSHSNNSIVKMWRPLRCLFASPLCIVHAHMSLHAEPLMSPCYVVMEMLLGAWDHLLTPMLMRQTRFDKLNLRNHTDIAEPFFLEVAHIFWIFGGVWWIPTYCTTMAPLMPCLQ